MSEPYVTKAERRARDAELRMLAREYAGLVREASSAFVYSGSAYRHKTDALNALNQRIVETYLGLKSSGSGAS